MVILLKVILGFLEISGGWALWTVFTDFRATRKQEGYDELSIWRRLRFNAISFLMMAGMASLIVFLIYFILVKITLG